MMFQPNTEIDFPIGADWVEYGAGLLPRCEHAAATMTIVAMTANNPRNDI
ncbi:MAG: hypothetical protein NVS4B6_24110 [Mycobacterium sp.]